MSGRVRVVASGPGVSAREGPLGPPAFFRFPTSRPFALLESVLVLGLALVPLACDAELDQARKDLRSSSVSLRVQALQLLGTRADPKLAASAAKLLRDPSPRVRRTAVATVGRLGCKGHVLALIERLADRDLEVRLAATRVLGDSSSRTARRPLLLALRDSSTLVRRASQRALVRLGMTRRAQQKALSEQFLREDIARLEDGRSVAEIVAATRRLGRSGYQATIAPLVRLLSKGRGDGTSLAAARALAAIGRAAALSPLVQLAGSASPSDRLLAARALPLAVRPLKRNPRSGVARAAAVAPALASLLTDREDSVRAAVLDGLAAEHALGVDEVRFKQQVCALLSAPATVVSARQRLYLARAAGQLAICNPQKRQIETEVSSLLRRTDLDNEAIARLVVVGAMSSELKSHSVLSVAKRLFELHRLDAEKWVKGADWIASARPVKGGAAFPVKPPAKREQAITWLLRRFPNRATTDPAFEPLVPPRVTARQVCALIAQLDGLPAQLDVASWLVQIVLSKTTASVRASAWLQLAGRRAQVTKGKAATLELLWAAAQKALADGPPVLSRAIVASCDVLGKRGAKLARSLLATKDFEMRSAAARCLGRLGDATGVSDLLAALAKEAERDIIVALAKIGDRRAAPPIARLLTDDHPASRQGERVILIQALGRLGDPRSVGRLARELSHPRSDVRLAAAVALGEIERAGARLHDKDGVVKDLEVCGEDYVAAVRVACRASLEAAKR